MKRLLFLAALLAAPIYVMAQQDKRVAILETVDKMDKVDYDIEFQIRAYITDAINRTPGYEGYDRVDMAQINKEQSFQRTGMVSDEDIKKIGEMTGASSIVVAEAVRSADGVIKVAAKIINIETGRIENSTKPYRARTDDEMDKACVSVVSDLLGGSSGGNTYTPPSRGIATSQRGQDFTETAFGINMRMVYVEGGTFTMGCTGDQGNECESDESPNRMTTVSSFYIGMLEVTQSQWEKVMGTSVYQQRDRANSNSTYGVGPEYPMYYVSWEEAKEFCARLSRQTGKTYRLPTEAEWEYAASGGKKNEGTKYSGGWSIGDVAWYTGNSSSSTHPCGTKRSNALGLYDMSGNVWEWCEDWYASQYLQYDNNNPEGASSGSDRVSRGGSWGLSAECCRVSYRNGGTPSDRYSYLGFRVVLVP
ncbi:MAG: formylglycine-generating enzyme family protein [Bacteroidales bacterium]|nr:formylglycine-generating enzyme family protein [Bacteroidales bacterium]